MTSGPSNDGTWTTPLPPLCPSNAYVPATLRRWFRQFSHRGFWRCIFQLVPRRPNAHATLHVPLRPGKRGNAAHVGNGITLLRIKNMTATTDWG